MNEIAKDKEVVEIQAKTQQTQQASQPRMKEIVRILHTDIQGSSNIYYGLTRIKGVSWMLSNAVCYLLKIPRDKKIGNLSDAEIKKIEETIKTLPSQPLPKFILNRPKTDEGAPKHIIGHDLDLQVRMDIKRLREIQSYKGIRHALGLPVRGQRTKSHFRHGRAIGVVKKKPQKTKKKTQ